MSFENRHEITTRRVVLDLPAAQTVVVRQGVPYAVVDGRPLTMDVYYPAADRGHALTPAVLFVTGYPDPGMRAVVGCNAKDMASYTSWARLTAASGLVAVTYVNHQPDNVRDVLACLQEQGQSLGIDANRLGLWSCSGNVPTALSVLMDRPAGVKCAVLCYGYTLDLDGATQVAEAADTFRFANPTARHPVEHLPSNVPLFIARAGRDEMPHLNAALDRFCATALELNFPVTLTNHHTGPHAFDIVDYSDASRRVVGQVLAFMQLCLSMSGQPV